MAKWEYLVLDRWQRKFETGTLDTGGLLTRQVWYLVAADGSLRMTLQKALTSLGEQGWELVAIVPMALERGQANAGVTTGLHVVMKRPVGGDGG